MKILQGAEEAKTYDKVYESARTTSYGEHTTVQTTPHLLFVAADCSRLSVSFQKVD